MDILLVGTITQNNGDGCSVQVAWDSVAPPHTWYLYTNQDPVWAIPLGRTSWGDALIDFAVNHSDQDLDYWRNAYFWRDRFGDL
ncbi:hypothetical protein [Gordonia aichiensis]|uniref:hypothetical protein n=1 Tax=Gordonia aichiensis TaxID=36820 RepID=UPI0032633BB5